MVDVKQSKPRTRRLWRLRELVRDNRAQDLIEYALLAAFVAVAAGGIMPVQLMPSVSRIFSRIVGLMQTLGGA